MYALKFILMSIFDDNLNCIHHLILQERDVSFGQPGCHNSEQWKSHTLPWCKYPLFYGLYFCQKLQHWKKNAFDFLTILA